MLSKIKDKFVVRRKSSSVSLRLRQKRFKIFLKLLNVTSDKTILDVGGTSSIWIGTGLEKNVTLLNLTTPKPEDIKRGFTCIQGDALDMYMIGDDQYDVVFSNSVIEHVGYYKNQKRFADEIQRVGRSYWVQTPNKYFPIEPHFLFPFFQFLPSGIQRMIALKWRFSYIKQWNPRDENILERLSEIRLLTEKELKSLFREGEMHKEKVWGLTKSLNVYRI